MEKQITDRIAMMVEIISIAERHFLPDYKVYNIQLENYVEGCRSVLAITLHDGSYSILYDDVVYVPLQLCSDELLKEILGYLKKESIK